jgi:hypothetical protein
MARHVFVAALVKEEKRLALRDQPEEVGQATNHLGKASSGETKLRK